MGKAKVVLTHGRCLSSSKVLPCSREEEVAGRAQIAFIALADLCSPPHFAFDEVQNRLENIQP